jgi:hypothetical protein
MFDDKGITERWEDGKPATVQHLSELLGHELRCAQAPGREWLVNKARVELAASWDYYGQFAKAREYSAHGETILEKLPRVQVPQEERELRQSQVRLAICFARSLYRSDELEDAEKMLSSLWCKS